KSLFGFLGPNGAGKTTTFSLLCGFVRPDAGTATILGEPLDRFVRSRGRMAALPQDARFHPERTVADSLAFLAELTGLRGDAARREADRVIEAVGLGDARGVRGRALSHGMSKRFGVAQAFLGSPELVLLDEPTEGLDPRNARTVREMIRSLAGRSTVVVSSHNLAEVEDLCDRAAILDRGRLVAAATMADLTGADEQVIVTLGAPLANAQAVLAAAAKAVETSADGLRLRVRLRVTPGTRPEAAITETLRALIAAGAQVGSVVRGRSLEERFLELT
ncbi:MAG: ABC transporter ATP-binding protein, partial [Deltaproteobacteria bacterium]|nr:ABC transporter ATP-binding protein [Deltaproteobacteria bacterium]